jgi:hypothetical protein
MKPSALLQTVWFTTAALAAQGCATYLPQLHLESPEATGSEKIGRAEFAGTQGGIDLVQPTTLSYPSPDANGVVGSPTPMLQTSWANYFLGFVKGFGDQWDVGIRIQPSAPLLIRVKYQFLGEPESRAELWNFSLAGLVSPGFSLSAGANGTSQIFFTADAALLAGIRLGVNHLVWLAPHFTFGSISGLPTTAGGSAGTVIAYGGGIGYQLTVLGFFGRAEFVWNWGSSGSAQYSGPAMGAVLGLRL